MTAPDELGHDPLPAVSCITDQGPGTLGRTRGELATLSEAVRLLTGTLELSEVLQRLTELVRARLGVDVVRIWLQEGAPAGFRLYAQAGVTRQPGEYRMRLGPGEGLVGWIMDHRTPLVLPDLRADPRVQNRDWMMAEGLVSFLGVPLLLEGAPVGTLAVLSRQCRVFSAEEVALAELLAVPAAIAIGNARLYQRAEERAEKLTALSTLTRLITSAPDSREVFHAVAEATTTLLGARISRVWVEDPMGRVLRIHASFGLDTRLEQAMTDFPAISYGQGLIGRLFESRAPEYIPDVQEDSRWLNQRLAKEADLHAFAGLPLITGDRVVGVLSILFADRRQFTPEEKEIMSLLADQAAIAIDRSRLFEELKRSYEEVRRTQEQLVRGETLQAVGEMASGIAHHLNNLLAVILGRIQLLRAKVQEPEIHRVLEIVERTTLDGAEVVRRVQEFSRAQPVAEAVPVDLNQLAQNVLELTRPLWQAQAQVRGIQIEAVLEPGQIPAVAGDPAALREVFMNLLFNAVDALPRGGQITVKTWASDQRVHCSVADTGVGMSEEVEQRALEPFFTTKGPRSTGLGLSVTYGIIKRHGGELSIESIPGHGTTVTVSLPFAAMAAPDAIPAAPLARPMKILAIDDEPEVRETLVEILASQGHLVSQSASGAEGISMFQVKIYLPRVEETAESVEPAKVLAGPPHGLGTILVVEDDEAIRELAREILQNYGYTVLEACHGGEALGICERHAGPIHLLVTDVVMPRMSGRELAGRLAPMRPEMKVLYVSGYTDNAIVHNGVLGPDIAFLQKPFAPDALARKVREVLDAPRKGKVTAW